MEHTPKTCDDCSLTWDRKGNVKDIMLCPFHRATPALLEALEKIHFEVDGAYLGRPASAANIRYIEGLARAAIKQAKGD